MGLIVGKAHRRFSTIAWIALILSGCQPSYDGLRIRLLSGTGEISDSAIEVEEGTAIVVQVEPHSSNPFEDYEKFNLVDLRPLNESVVWAARADDVDRFVLVGAGVGQTSIDVVIDDRSEDILSAVSTPQEVP
jgi:hypothetical protein